MKLLYIINSLGTGGAEKLVVDMLPIMQQKGIQVELLVLKKVKSIFEKAILDHDITITYSPHSLYSPYNILFIRKFVRNFDLVHVHLFPAQYWSAFTFSKTPMVVTEHCTNNERRAYLIFRPIERFTYGRFRKTITISEKANAALKKWLRFSDDYFIVIENGINMGPFFKAKSKEIEGIPTIAKKIIMVGRFFFPKDQATAIKAMSLLDSDIHLLLVGDGDTKAECQQLAKNLNVEDRVHFLGIRSDIPDLLKSCDFNLIASHSEGLSLSSLEALASGRPLVTSDVSGLREINQGAGLLFEDKNPQALANCIDQLLNDPQYYDSIVERCLQRVTNYDIRKTVKEHITVYNEVLENS